jgi:hypothetical protein
VVDDEELQREAKLHLLVILIVGFDIRYKAPARDLLGCLAEGIIISLWKGIEMSFDRRLQSTLSRYRIYGGDSFFHHLVKPKQGYAWNTGLVRLQPDE